MVRPILFNGEMVRAILEGRKTVTRRIIRPRYRDDESGFQVVTSKSGEFIRVEKVDEDECGIFSDGTERYVNPPFQTGDILYVRETWTYHKDAVGGIIFKVRCPKELTQRKKWHPSIHMPKKAARIWLKVKDVRAERLQDIGIEGCEKEGIWCGNNGDIFAFMKLWDSTIKKPDIDCYGWNANPWVWVIGFERCEKPEEAK